MCIHNLCFELKLGNCNYNPPALLLPTVLVNIIVIVVYFYPRLRILLNFFDPAR